MKFSLSTLLCLSVLLVAGCNSKQAESPSSTESAEKDTAKTPAAAPFAKQTQALDKAKGIEQIQENSLDANQQKIDAQAH